MNHLKCVIMVTVEAAVKEILQKPLEDICFIIFIIESACSTVSLNDN